MIPQLIRKCIFRPARRLAVLAIVLAMLAAGGLAAFIHFFDLNAHKAEIEKAATAAIGKPFVIGGDVKMGFRGLRPSVVLHGVSLGERGRDSVLSADRVEAALSLRPLLSGEKELLAEVDNLRVDGVKFGDYESPLLLVPGGVKAPGIRGRLEDARVTGAASFVDGEMRVDLRVRGLDYAQVFAGMKGGDMRAEIVLESRGNIPQNLSGRFSLAGGKGEMESRALDFWGADLLTSVFLVHEKNTAVNCAMTDFRVENGVARTNATVIDTGKVAVFGKGTINLAKGRVDMKFTPKPKSRAIVSLATPVRVQGAFGDIQVVPDAKGAVKTLGTLLLGAVNPTAALVPFVLQDTAPDSPCLKYLEGKE